jgi:hypothetical protein
MCKSLIGYVQKHLVASDPPPQQCWPVARKRPQGALPHSRLPDNLWRFKPKALRREMTVMGVGKNDLFFLPPGAEAFPLILREAAYNAILFKRDILGSFSARPTPTFEFLQSALLSLALTPLVWHPFLYHSVGNSSLNNQKGFW